jgi:hypothetical protein
VTALTFIGAFVIAGLIVFAGWAVLIGVTQSGCHTDLLGQVCGDGFISTNGLLIAAGCLLGALAIAVMGSAVARLRRRPS